MRRSLALIAVAVMLSLALGYALGVSAQERPVRIIVDGKEIQCDPPAFIKGDRTFVPVRFVAEALGARVNWDDKDFRVLIDWPEWYPTPAELISLGDLADAGIAVTSGPESMQLKRESTVVRFWPPRRAEVIVNGVKHGEISAIWLPYVTCFRRVDLERFGLLPAEH